MPCIKELKMFTIFVSMATELTDRQTFTKYCNSNANYLVTARRNMDYVNTFWQVYICLARKIENIEII